MITVTDYHNRTKHGFNAYAKGPETLDWDDQPNPFRRFLGCPTFQLPVPGKALDITWSALTTKQVSPAALNMDNLGLMLELAFGLSAWKVHGPDTWSVRCNPSSGNLHPSEVYVVNTCSELLPAGVYHYVSDKHQLEQRCQFADTALDEGLWLGLTSVYWREAWKYGERAFRYCQLDAGHALAALSYAAACLGWRITLAHDIVDDALAMLLGVDRQDDFVKREGESPDWLCRIEVASETSAANLPLLIDAASKGEWQGKAESLKAYHLYHWKVIEAISQRTTREKSLPSLVNLAHVANTPSSQVALASTLIRQRRSAQRFQLDAQPMRASAFARILSSVMPGNNPPFNAWDLGVAVHLVLFVHKVEGLASGVYCLPRTNEAQDQLKAAMKQAFDWAPQKDFPGLYLLQQGDTRKAAKSLSCFQSIASDGAFSLAMLGEFEKNVAISDWQYRRLFWECGLLGQVFYLEAEAEGFRGTGIGCFFDDEVHHALGLTGNAFQSLYHFTVGIPMEDDRIQTLPAYSHLQQKISF